MCARETPKSNALFAFICAFLLFVIVYPIPYYACASVPCAVTLCFGAFIRFFDSIRCSVCSTTSPQLKCTLFLYLFMYLFARIYTFFIHFCIRTHLRCFAGHTTILLVCRLMCEAYEKRRENKNKKKQKNCGNENNTHSSDAFRTIHRNI